MKGAVMSMLHRVAKTMLDAMERSHASIFHTRSVALGVGVEGTIPHFDLIDDAVVILLFWAESTFCVLPLSNIVDRQIWMVRQEQRQVVGVFEQWLGDMRHRVDQFFLDHDAKFQNMERLADYHAHARPKGGGQKT